MRGDYRSLFLGWLADFDAEEWRDSGDGAVVVPPIPAGLERLSPALVALIGQFPVDCDALAVATELSLSTIPDRIPAATVLEQLSGSKELPIRAAGAVFADSRLDEPGFRAFRSYSWMPDGDG